MISQRNLSLLSNRLARAGGRRVPEAVLERDYCIAWFLVGLSRTPLRERITFKGGTALKQCYFGHYRFSEDLDFTLVMPASFEIIQNELDPLFAEVERAAGIVLQFLHRSRDDHANTYTFFIGYEGPLPATARPKQVKVDITIRDQLVYPFESRPVLRAYDEYHDLPGGARIDVYSLEEIAAEKVVALMDRARNEPRDLYDLWYLVERTLVDVPDLVGAIEQKLEFRGKDLASVQDEFAAKEHRFRRLWDARLAAQMSELPKFDGVFRAVKRALRRAKVIAR